MEKTLSAIRRITLDSASFANTGATVSPTCVNFFFGRNGVGKSTLARAIAADRGVLWEEGASRSQYDVLVYDQEFIHRNFSEYDNLPGVITIHQQNIEAQRRLAEKKEEKAEIEARGKGLAREREDKLAAREAAAARFQKRCWERTAQLREDLKEAFKGKLKIALFASAVQETAAPAEHDPGELKNLYDTAFSTGSRVYPLFQKADGASTYGSMSGGRLLGQPVVSSSGAPFARFIKALNATDWVRQGHAHYVERAGGKCPFCQQALPAGFDQEIAACFDAQYQRDIADLRSFEAVYKRETAAILQKLAGNMRDVLPTVDLTEYRDKLALLQSKTETNRQRIEGKLREPASLVALEDTDSLLLELGQIIDRINRQIESNNSIVSDRRKKQALCRQQAWELAAFILREEKEAYQAEREAMASRLAALDSALDSCRRELRTVTGEISALNRQGVNTEEAVSHINSLLRDAGFQGFSLEPKPGVKDVYQVVRPGGAPAGRLSEGERNFIAFLYFYQLVLGNGQANGALAPGGGDTREKIVVIDDPASGMDQSALLLSAALIRDLVAACHGSGSSSRRGLVKQLFFLTHNAQLHHEVSREEIPHFSHTAFFAIRKEHGRSTVVPCVYEEDGNRRNYSPVQDAYGALWEELRRLCAGENAGIAIESVCRRILQQYFQQICGFAGGELRHMILEENKERFAEETAGGVKEYKKYRLAAALLRPLGEEGFFGDMLAAGEEADNETYREVFQTIFTSMGHRRHYQMMMGGPGMEEIDQGP